MNFKVYITFILLVISFRLWSQQPRMSVVDSYLSETGMPVTDYRQHIERRYCLPIKRYKTNEKLILNLPVFRSLGVRAIIPFGFILNKQSDIVMHISTDNMQESKFLPLKQSNVFKSISYFFSDSVAYGVKLRMLNKPIRHNQQIADELNGYFGAPDFSDSTVIVYSDEDFLVRVCHERDEIEIFSLFHYPVLEILTPGVKQIIYYGHQWFCPADGEALMLAFFAQVSKENNIQTAMKVYHKGNELVGFQQIQFILDNNVILSFPLKQEFVDLNNGKKIERDTRVFIFSEQMKKILQSTSIQVEIVGTEKSITYKMPEFQKYSLRVIYEYSRWQMTNPMVKYSGI